MKTITIKYLLISTLFFSFTLAAQVPYPAGAQQKPILISGGTIHVGNGQVIENGAIAFEAGKLTYVGSMASMPADKSKYEVIAASGKQIYPGFIMTNSQLGLVEVSSVRATLDSDEYGDFNPNVRSLISYNTDSEIIPTFRFNGILLAEAAPQGGVISGTSSVMQLEGWNWEDAVHTKDVAIHLNWPGMQKGKFDFETFTFIYEPNPDYVKNVEDINLFFNDAISYGKLAAKEVNLKMEAMQGLFNGSQALIIHSNAAKEIIDAVKFAQSHGVKRIVLLADEQALHVTAFLKDNNIPVILPPVHSIPSRDDDATDLSYSLPGLLSKAGIMIALSHDGMLANGRNLPFYAGTAVAYGLDKEEALKAITLNPAKILGIDKVTGSLETGKDATLFISGGDALDFIGNKVVEAFIVGKRVQLNNKQEDLYDRYSKKYGHKK
jgi:imidazolonepropionase-like amidohydrolase